MNELSARPLQTTTLRTLGLASEILPQTPFLAAASGLVVVGDRYVVAADDALHLGMFPVGSEDDGTLFRVQAGSLPADPVARKRRKPDFEALTEIPPCRRYPHGALVVMGSGSTPDRETATIVGLTSSGELSDDIGHRDLGPLFDPFRERCGEINVEGAFVLDEELVVIARAHGSSPDNHVARYRLSALARWLEEARTGAVAPTSVIPLRLPTLEGVPLGITDAAALPGGGWVFSAVAEDTNDSYNDGQLTGAVIGQMGVDGRPALLARLSPTAKVEGIVASRISGRTVLTMVTDADDPATPAVLLVAELPD